MTARSAGGAVGREGAVGDGDGRETADGSGVFAAARRITQAKPAAGVQANRTIRRTGL